MTIEQIIVLAVVQGITEFLPISSSGHLILVPQIMHWQDQGLVVDVMTHLGTLLAILIYFWRDVARLIRGALELLKGKVTPDGRLAIYIVLATIPAVAFGIFLKEYGFTDLERNVAVVAWNTILYGILMLIADMVRSAGQDHRQHDPRQRAADRRGASLGADPGHQPLGRDHDRRALPGLHASRLRRASRFCSASRPSPAPASSRVGDALREWRERSPWMRSIAPRSPSSPALPPSPSSWRVVKRISFLPFVLYRMVLGGFLLVLLYT